MSEGDPTQWESREGSEREGSESATDRRRATRDGGEERTRWEYETVRPPRDETMKESADPTATLNDLGAAGWEFVDTITYEGGGTKYLVFKRPVGADGRS